MKVYKKALLPLEFQSNGITCGIKKSAKLDLALFYSRLPAKAACKFTTNKLPAAPIILDKINLKEGKRFQAVIVNSGNANCFTGRHGLSDAWSTAAALAGALRLNKKSILVSSTGIIGRRLPLAKIKKAIPQLAAGLSRLGIDKAKRAIMTTDTFVKEISVRFNIGSRTVTLCGVAKGAGMIAPDMATMLAFILTDADISQGALNKALKICLDHSFNCITVDGCMSTNDSLILLANGASRNSRITPERYFSPFVKALNTVCRELAKMIVADAEGASKFIKITVRGGISFAQAKRVALAVANSSLFKTAMFGENPNFGRIVAAVGASGVRVSEKDLKIRVSPLHKREINVEIGLAQGRFDCTVYTSDLSPEYVKINAGYN